MKQIFFLLTLLIINSSFSQDTTFWNLTADFEPGQKGSLTHDWGSETITYLGTITWTSPSGKELTIRIITTYQKLTKANGFNDRSIIALVKEDHTLIKTYDLVKRQNLPIAIRDNLLVFNPDGTEILSPMPAKLGVRFCVEGMICYDEIELE